MNEEKKGEKAQSISTGVAATTSTKRAYKRNLVGDVKREIPQDDRRMVTLKLKANQVFNDADHMEELKYDGLEICQVTKGIMQPLLGKISELMGYAVHVVSIIAQAMVLYCLEEDTEFIVDRTFFCKCFQIHLGSGEEQYVYINFIQFIITLML